MSEQVWVAHAGEDTLGVWELEPLRETGRMDIPRLAVHKARGARRLSWDPGFGRLYVSCTYANSVGVVDPAAGRWLEEVAVGAAPTDICVCRERVIVCCCESESLWALDRETPSAVGCIRLPGFPYSMDGSGDALLLCCLTRPAIWSVDEALSVSGVLEPETGAMHATGLAGGDVLATLLPLNASRAGRLARISKRTGCVKRTLGMGTMPGTVRVSPDGGVAVAASMSEGEVLFADPETLRLKRSVHVGAMPDDILFLPDGRGVLVTCMLEETIVWLDIEGNLVGSARTGKEPRGLALIPGLPAREAS